VGSGDLTRVLTSPLRFPNLGADQNSFTSITALALGAFTGHADRQEAVALAVTARGIEDLDEEGTQLWLTFIENRGAGLAIVDPRQAPFEFPPELSWSLEQSWAEFSTPVMQALDLDADGVDELVVCSSQVVQGELAYWVIRRQGGAWSSEQHQVAVAGASDLAIRASSYGDGADEPLSGPVDVDSDGKLDLMARGGGDAGPFVVVLRNGGSGTLAGGTALALDPTVQAAAFANVDGDRALELVAVGERGVQFYDVDLLSGALEERTTDIPSGAVSRLTVGDFDGDGITDIATAGEAVTVYFGDPESR
jgi:hypothetical protein